MDRFPRHQIMFALLRGHRKTLSGFSRTGNNSPMFFPHRKTTGRAVFRHNKNSASLLPGARQIQLFIFPRRKNSPVSVPRRKKARLIFSGVGKTRRVFSPGPEKLAELFPAWENSTIFVPGRLPHAGSLKGGQPPFPEPACGGLPGTSVRGPPVHFYQKLCIP